MAAQEEPGVIRWRVQLASSPEVVFRNIATDDGRAAFWADSAVETDGVIAFRFSNGAELEARVLDNHPPERFSLTYFDGSHVEFELEPDGRGGTLLTLTERGFDPAARDDQLAGWVSLLMSMKAAIDFGIDLRNPDPERDWEGGFIDV